MFFKNFSSYNILCKYLIVLTMNLYIVEQFYLHFVTSTKEKTPSNIILHALATLYYIHEGKLRWLIDDGYNHKWKIKGCH